MKKKMLYLSTLVALILFSGGGLYAGQPLNGRIQSLVNSYLAEAQKKEPGLKSFSAEEGKKFYNAKRTHSVKRDERSCATCHTADPVKHGKTPAGKDIAPLSPAANKDRFADSQKVEKWFKRNCEWVLERECTSKEKGDFIAYMMSL